MVKVFLPHSLFHGHTVHSSCLTRIIDKYIYHSIPFLQFICTFFHCHIPQVQICTWKKKQLWCMQLHQDCDCIKIALVWWFTDTNVWTITLKNVLVQLYMCCHQVCIDTVCYLHVQINNVEDGKLKLGWNQYACNSTENSKTQIRAVEDSWHTSVPLWKQDQIVWDSKI